MVSFSYRVFLEFLAFLVVLRSVTAFYLPTFFGSSRALYRMRESRLWMRSLPNNMDDSDDWRAFRAKLVSIENAGKLEASLSPSATQSEATNSGAERREWVHEIASPEPGCLLLANPSKFMGAQNYFARAVVLLVAHDDPQLSTETAVPRHATEGEGSIGFLLNRQTPFTIGDIAPSMEIFARCPLYIGGPVGDGLQFIHGVPNVHGSRQIMEGVYYGGNLRHAAYLIRKMGVTPQGIALMAQSFRFFYKYCSWGAGQLKKELSNTTTGAPLQPPSPVWYTVAGSAEYVLAGVSPQRARWLRTHTTNVLWKDILRKMGARFAAQVPPLEATDDDPLAQHPLLQQYNRSDCEKWKALLFSATLSHTPAPCATPPCATPPCATQFLQNGALALADAARATSSQSVTPAPPPCTPSVLEEACLRISQIHAELEAEERAGSVGGGGLSRSERGGQREEVVEEGVEEVVEEGGPGDEVTSHICRQLDALAAQAQRVLVQGTRWGGNRRGGDSVVGGRGSVLGGGPSMLLENELRKVEAINEVLFREHHFRVAEDLAEFPLNPQYFILGEVLRTELGDPCVLALLYQSVAARLGLRLLGVCAGGQRLLRTSGDEERGPRNPSGRRCHTRNIWPLKRTQSQPPAPLLLLLSPPAPSASPSSSAPRLPPGEERGDGSKTMGGSLKDLPEWGEGGVGEVGGQELELIDTGTGGGQRGEEEREGEGAARSPKEEDELVVVTDAPMIISRMLTDLVHAYLERDDPERAFRYSDSLAALDAAYSSLSK